jgi:hypothetical protein
MSFITVKCPSWDYETVADWNSILAARSKAALVRLRQLSPERRIALGRDGRPVHGQYFAGLTPPGCAYYAGHYRGEDFTCLKDYRVITKAIHSSGTLLIGSKPTWRFSRQTLCRLSPMVISFELLITQ